MDSIEPSTDPSTEPSLPTRRKLDLHGFPLAVAKAAIDHEIKTIYDHCEYLMVTEEMNKSSAMFGEDMNIFF
jgi:hypothetical protein